MREYFQNGKNAKTNIIAHKNYTPQAYSAGVKQYLITRYLHAPYCTWYIGIGYPINTETYPRDLTRAHN